MEGDQSDALHGPVREHEEEVGIHLRELRYTFLPYLSKQTVDEVVRRKMDAK